jgi:hypothetical protein
MEIYAQQSVWAAAMLAHKLNDGYFTRGRAYVERMNGKTTRTNVSLIMGALKEKSEFAQELILQGQATREYLSKVYTAKCLYSTLNEFEKQDVDAINCEKFDDVLSISSVARLISKAEELKALEGCLTQVPEDCIGAVKSRNQFEIYIVSSAYSTRYDSFIIKGIVNDKVPVMFFYKKSLPTDTTVSVKATVKRYAQDTVQFNRVTILN